MIKVNSGQYYVILAEASTGIILTPAGKRNISGATPYEVFDSFEAAEAYSYQKINEILDVECNIYDDNSTRVKIVQ